MHYTRQNRRNDQLKGNKLVLKL